VIRLLRLCRIDRDHEGTVSEWVDGFERSEWNAMRPRTILGAPYVGPRP
jgi:hypothetical protein